MAPAKNNANCNNNQNINDGASHNNCSNNNVAASSTTSPVRKQTGTVPKLSATTTAVAASKATATTKRLTSTLPPPGLQQQQQFNFSNSRCSPLIMQQQQQQRQNTEIVPIPIRRELKVLNDYLLSTVVTNTNPNTAIKSAPANSSNCSASSSNNHQQQLPNISNNTIFQKPPKQQQQQLNDSNYEIENITETQRFCYPVRPIPRRNQQQQQNDNTTNTLSTNLLNHAATTIGIVIPTTAATINSTTNDAAAATALINYNHQQQQQQQQQQQLQQHLLLLQLQQLIEEPTLTVPQQQQHQQQQHNFSLPTNLLDLAESLSTATASATPSASVLALASNCSINDSSSPALQKRLQLIQQFLNLTSNNNNGSSKTSNSCSTRSLNEATANSSSANLLRNTHQQQRSKMVHEINPNTTEHDVIVNSASLEDVPHSEMSDNRAQSIQSLHSVLETLETPTPDTTPSYDELQQRLEASNRNIHNMQEQQQQLLRLQNAAKMHLSEMEELRHHAGQLSFGGGAAGSGGGSGTQQAQQQNGGTIASPEYESIEQVHSDMATLVGRMKNLTTFIQNQNELSTLLGDDGPEILAEQEALQRKLESLRTQRDEMRNLVTELQDVNRNAERSANKEIKYRENDNDDEEEEIKDLTNNVKNVGASNAATNQQKSSANQQQPTSSSERVVPVEYSRIVPIELLQAGAGGARRQQQFEPQTIDNDDRAPTAEESALIQQKVADIEAMKAQLKRLKDMMETVNLIETHTSTRPDPKQIGRTPPTRDQRSQSSTQSSSNTTYDRERTPTAADNEEDAFISRKVRMLNEVTSDLRAQAESLQAERDRIKALKDEIERRKAQAAAAAQLGEDALKRHSLTPTPTPHRHRLQQQQQDEQAAVEDRDQLKAEYETKKKEFELLCQRLQQEDVASAATSTPLRSAVGTTTTRRHEIVSEADDEADEDMNDSDYTTGNGKYYDAAASGPTTLPLSLKTTRTTTANHGKDSSLNSTVASSTVPGTAGVGANSTQEGASMEAASMQSGSTRSFSIPPPMAALGSSNWPGPIPPPLPSSWNPHFYYGAGALPTAPPPPPQAVGPFSPPHHNHHHYSLLQHGGGGGLTAAGSDCAATPGGGAGGATGTASSTASAAAQLASSDPVLLQQFVQTQQMLINSVCQCNQMLWHQQREIDSLNNTIHMLQDRLYTLSGPSAADLAFNLRSESVPPSLLADTANAAMPNNLYSAALTGHNRAQSEQPIAAAAYLPSGPSTRSAFTNYHQQQQQQQQLLHQQQQQHLFQQRQRSVGATSTGVYNYNSETQQNVSSATAASTSIYSTLNNAVVPPTQQQQQQQQQFNNEAPQSPLTGAGGPGPIFMHHHNNSIHQNNANLRTQNHHANNLQHQQQQQQHNNVTNISSSSNNNTLNNQVPPGNRANNFWDNFRSYSRQNLLSTNSHKSNEDQQQHLQQQQQQQQQQQHEHEEQYHPQRPALTQNLRHHHLQRSRINQMQQQQQYQQQQQQQQQQQEQQQQQQNIANNMLHNLSNLYQRDFLENLNWPESSDALYDNYNIVDTDLSATFATGRAGGGGVGGRAAEPPSNLRNMNNVNFGNSPHYQRNKVLAKPPCRATTISAAATATAAATLNRNRTQQTLLRNIDDFAMPQQQHFRNEPYAGALATTQNQQHFGMLPTASTNIAAGRAGSSNHRERDFLLRTVDVANAAAADYVYMPSPVQATENIAAAAGAGIVDDFEDANATATAGDDDDDDDTTSEEIKRNLLVNALKNDKFTTKFYESIKEDVFRRLESMLLEKESSDRQRSEQQQPQPPPPPPTQLFNDVGSGGSSSSRARDLRDINSAAATAAAGGAGARDPMRKLYLNERMSGNPQLPQSFVQLQLELEQHAAERNNDDDDDEEEDEEANHNADTESNNADNETTSTAAAAATWKTAVIVAETTKPPQSLEINENEKPEEDDIERCSNAAAILPTMAERSKDAAKWRKNVSSGGGGGVGNIRHLEPLPSPAVTALVVNKNAAKKRKNQRSSHQRNSNECHEPPSAAQSAGIAAAQQPKGQRAASNDESYNANNTSPSGRSSSTADHDLINYIIIRIKKQTHANTLINDSLLVEIAKLTATAAQNSTTATQPPPNISPKKIYAKIKKLSLPRQRDEFLVWYQNYLETLFPIAVSEPHDATLSLAAAAGGAKLQYEQTNRKIQKSNIPIKSKVNELPDAAAATKPMQKQLQSNNTVVPPNPAAAAIDILAAVLQVNDADLAEADQIQSSANTSSNTSNMLLQHEQSNDDEGDSATAAANANVAEIKPENILANAAAAAQVKNEIDELENDENPEEEGGVSVASSVVVAEAVGAAAAGVEDEDANATVKTQAADFKDSGGFVNRNGLA